MCTVKQLRKILETMPDEYEVVIYPKYSSDKVNGFNKHPFLACNVCLQEPHTVTIKHNKKELFRYTGKKHHEHYEINNHVAILF